MTDPRQCPYYAKGRGVWKRPILTKNDDGSATISIGFKICKISDDMEYEAANTVAELMNLGHQASAKK